MLMMSKEYANPALPGSTKMSIAFASLSIPTVKLTIHPMETVYHVTQVLGYWRALAFLGFKMSKLSTLTAILSSKLFA